MGDLRKAIATPVVSSILVEFVAATASGRNGSWRFSNVAIPVKPLASNCFVKVEIFCKFT